MDKINYTNNKKHFLNLRKQCGGQLLTLANGIVFTDNIGDIIGGSIDAKLKHVDLIYIAIGTYCTKLNVDSIYQSIPAFLRCRICNGNILVILCDNFNLGQFRNEKSVDNDRTADTRESTYIRDEIAKLFLQTNTIVFNKVISVPDLENVLNHIRTINLQCNIIVGDFVPLEFNNIRELTNKNNFTYLRKISMPTFTDMYVVDIHGRPYDLSKFLNVPHHTEFLNCTRNEKYGVNVVCANVRKLNIIGSQSGASNSPLFTGIHLKLNKIVAIKIVGSHEKDMTIAAQDKYTVVEVYNNFKIDKTIREKMDFQWDNDIVSLTQFYEKYAILMEILYPLYFYDITFDDIQDFMHIREKGTIYQIINNKEKICTIKQILQIFKSLHEKNIGHGDIKQENLGINSDNNIKLFDFGLSEYSGKPNEFSQYKLDVIQNDTIALGKLFVNILVEKYMFAPGRHYNRDRDTLNQQDINGIMARLKHNDDTMTKLLGFIGKMLTINNSVDECKNVITAALDYVKTICVE